MDPARPLLLFGNDKLSEGVARFDLPAVRTCPGRSLLCSEEHCYATKGRYNFPQVRRRLEWALGQSRRGDFAGRMADEIYRRGVILMRWHCSGDLYSPEYAAKVFEAMARSPHCSHWLYTRSWRVPAVMPWLDAMSELPNARVWLSADAETGLPPRVPSGARVCWMQTAEGGDAGDAELVFLVRPLRHGRLPLDVLAKACPTETPEGKAKGVTCATCQRCWRP